MRKHNIIFSATKPSLFLILTIFIALQQYYTFMNIFQYYHISFNFFKTLSWGLRLDAIMLHMNIKLIHISYHKTDIKLPVILPQLSKSSTEATVVKSPTYPFTSHNDYLKPYNTTVIAQQSKYCKTIFLNN